MNDIDIRVFRFNPTDIESAKRIYALQGEIAAKDAEILEKHPKIGSKINWVRHNKWKLVAGAATGGVTFAAGWFSHKFFGKKAEEPAIEAEITPVEESEAAPFDTEA